MSNVTQLHEFLYGTADYTPSSTVQTVNSNIIYTANSAGSSSTTETYDDGSSSYDDGSGYYDDGSGYYDDGSSSYDDGSGSYDDGNGYYEDSSGGYDDGSSGGSYDPGDSDGGSTAPADPSYAGPSGEY